MLLESRISGGSVILVVRSGGVPVVCSACKGGLAFSESVVLDPCIVCGGGVVEGSVVCVVGVVGMGVVVVSGTDLRKIH